MSVEQSALYGVMAEFDSADALLGAARRARAAGYRRLTAYSPFPIDDLPEALGYSERTGIRPIILAGGVLGALTGYLLQWWTSSVDYPINVGGRPYNAWQAFVPITFELMVLFAALFAVVGLLALNGLPMPYHPVFNVPAFVGATRDRFFLCVESRDPRFDPDATRRFLASLHPLEVSDVPD
jgi:hypothetical protein